MSKIIIIIYVLYWYLAAVDFCLLVCNINNTILPTADEEINGYSMGLSNTESTFRLNPAAKQN